MDETKDRRSFNRLIFPEKAVLLANTGWLHLLKYRMFHSIALLILRETLIKNISASGSCILSTNNVQPGKIIHIILSTPGEKTVCIKGKVRWISSDASSEGKHVGIQFLAYGNGKKYNSYQILKKLHIFALQSTI